MLCDKNTKIRDFLKDDELVDDLQRDGLLLIQKKTGFKFGIDAVLLSDIVQAKEHEIVMDLCSGTGVVAILVSAKTQANQIIGVEIDEELSKMARRSVQLNSLESRIDIVNEDVRKLIQNHKKWSGQIDVICANPPYFKQNSAILNDDMRKMIARHEVCLNLPELFMSVNALLKPRGVFYMIHRPDRLVDIFEMARLHRLEPKEMRMVYPKVGKASNLVLLKFIKDANAELKIIPSLYVYDENGDYTSELLDIYGK